MRVTSIVTVSALIMPPRTPTSPCIIAGCHFLFKLFCQVQKYITFRNNTFNKNNGFASFRDQDMTERTYQIKEQRNMTMVSKPQRWTIFTSMLDAVSEKERSRLRFAKCSGCNRINPYRLANLEEDASEIRCRKCGTKISIQDKRRHMP